MVGAVGDQARMTETLDKTVQGRSWLAAIAPWRIDHAVRIRNLDLCAALIAVLLPWTTTGTLIAIGLFVIGMLFTDLRGLPETLRRPVCVLPLALVGLALVGTLWSDAPWPVRLHAIGAPAKLLVLPLLIYHFQRSPRGGWVFAAFLASCALLMLYSFLVAIEPRLSFKLYFSRGPYWAEKGIAVRNYIDQSQELSLIHI